MRIKINGRFEEFVAEELTITEVLAQMKYTLPELIIKFKGEIVNEDCFDKVLLRDNDEILIIHVFAGG